MNIKSPFTVDLKPGGYPDKTTIKEQGCSGARTRGDGVPHFFRQEGRVPHSPTFWIEIRAKVSPLLQLVTYWNIV